MEFQADCILIQVHVRISLITLVNWVHFLVVAINVDWNIINVVPWFPDSTHKYDHPVSQLEKNAAASVLQNGPKMLNQSA